MCVLGDVVEEDGHGTRVRHGAEVRRQRLERRPGGEVGRRTHEHDVGTGGGGGLGQRNRLSRRLGTRPGDEQLAVTQLFARELHQLLLLVGVEQGRLTGGPGYDHARDALGEQLGDVLPELAGREVARPRVERRRDGGKDSRGRLLPNSHFGSMLDKSSVKPAGLSDAGAADAAAGAGATRERRRSVFIWRWNSEGLDEAASAVSAVTMSLATRSMRC